MPNDSYQAALLHYRAGQIPDAQAMLRRVLAQQPAHFDALALLAMLAQRSGRLDEAVELLRRTVALRSDLPETHYNLGNALKAAGQVDEAIRCFQQAISLRPDFAEAHFNLANALRGAGRLKEAIESFRRTIAARPTHAGALNNLASSLREAGFADEALAAVQQAIAHKPDMPEAHNNLGNLLLDRGQTEQAIGSFARALQIRPQYVEALNNLGNAQRALGRFDAAEQAYRTAAAIQPDSAQTLWNLGTVQLALGNLRDGFANYEGRLKLPNTSAMDFPQPLWQGENLQGKSILLHAEQGMGDAIQFIRYVPLVKERGARVIVICHDPLTRLLAGQLEIDQVIGFSEAPPTFDVHCPLMSLPHVFGTTLASIPSRVPYLIADATLTQKWRQRLSELPPRRNIGIVWAGNPAQTNDRFRSMSLSDLAPLAQVKEARFISLQKGAAAGQANTPPPGVELCDWSAELEDFVDTAALISALDGVVSVCTSPAHLAGALGKPVWLLLWKDSDWRWLLDRSDSPWYPTMRLFRQSHAGQWAEPVEAVVRDLAASKSE